MRIGEINELKVLRFTSVGAYLGDEEDNDVLFPNKYIPEDLEIDDTISVFIYRDSEDRLVATNETPYIELNGYAYLNIKDVNLYGAFADWGLEKDLLIPYKEQTLRLDPGEKYLVSLRYDQATDRLYGSMKVKNLLEKCREDLPMNTEVDLLICNRTELGTKVILNNKFSGLIFNSDMDRKLRSGDKTKGYVLKVREDGKMDIRLSPAGYGKISDSAEKLLEILKKRGSLKLTDKSDPDDIREAVGMSKKTFKQAVGNLYKQRLIKLNETNIELAD